MLKDDGLVVNGFPLDDDENTFFSRFTVPLLCILTKTIKSFGKIGNELVTRIMCSKPFSRMTHVGACLFTHMTIEITHNADTVVGRVGLFCVEKLAKGIFFDIE